MRPRGRSPFNGYYEMRVVDSREASTINNWTKCSKMTEEGHRIYGINGNTDGGAVAPKEESSKNAYNQGGRLKFFKDGKFILELERARDGEKVSWVSVPRKTYWPPQGNATSTPTYRQESSTSLSVSDDNSSIQSSPWQRDHSWKQTTPRRNLSKEMAFYYCHRRNVRVWRKCKNRRRPYAIIPVDNTFLVVKTERNSVCNKVTNKVRVRPPVLSIVQMLVDKSVSNTPPRPEVVVSPRKRFLREMEKDKVQVDDACQKRSRNKTQSSGTPPVTIKVESPIRLNGITEDMRAPRNCSYSITSLLAEDRSARRSPDHFSPVTQYCTPSEDPMYSESVDRLRSIELSQVEKRTLAAYTSFPYMPPYMYPYSLPPYYSSGVYGRNYMVPPVYPALPMPVSIRHETPSCSWSADAPKDEHRDDGITDMPLNLSKHAG
ncbi:hypothetical protein RN001_000291 [Aquatica leii]|uniref:Protein hairless n=1 Tax=Aquatica leii TaxID=1421715 RepID=A0AAN7P9P6_9COLE|nr:hypothetical protein RN001_000291 [Aquatica leii]